jgi:hypothetical protein
MLKVNIGLSRKLSADYQSKGYTLNIEGELPSDVLNNHVALADATNKLFDLANQLLDEQIQNDSGTQSTSRSRRAPGPSYSRSPNGHTRQPVRSNGYRQNGSNGQNGHAPAANGNGSNNGNANGNAGGERLLTQAQTRAIINMAKKLGHDPDQYVQDNFGVVHVSELTIKQASEAIDALKNDIQKVGV